MKMNTILALHRIKVHKLWEPNSEPIQIIYNPHDTINEMLNKIAKILNLDIDIDNTTISSSNPLIQEINSNETFQELRITPQSELYVKILKSNKQQKRKEIPTHIIPLIELIKNDQNDLPPAGYDLTQKMIIIYGIAANLYYYFSDDSNTKGNISPNYIFIDDHLEPYIDFDKLEEDSQDSDNFLNLNANFSPYFPQEIKNKTLFAKTNEDPNSNIKADIYTFGSICLSIMSKSVLTDEHVKAANIPTKFLSLINSFRNDNPYRRPTFKVALTAFTNQIFINSLEQFDAKRFQEYQKTVVGDEFITKIISNFDFRNIPGVEIRKRSDFEQRNRQIGKGMSGSVYLAVDSTNGKDVALKELEVLGEGSSDKQMRLYREIEILAGTNHPAVQKLYGLIEPDKENKKNVIITLYEQNGSLNKFLDRNFKSLNFTQKYIIAYGIAAGLYYLQKRSIIHRDVKPENILITDQLEPEITDFGLSKSRESDLFNSICGVGTPLYMAPEIFIETGNEGGFSIYNASKADVFSYGMTLIYVFVGKHPWSNVRNSLAIQKKLANSERPKELLDPEMPEMIRLLIKACTCTNPKERPSFEDILHILGNQFFIDSFNNQVNIDQFKAYQKKVVINESFLLNNIYNLSGSNPLNSQEILINGIKFPVLPEDKVFEETYFTVKKEEKENPFFLIYEGSSTNQPEGPLNFIQIKNEYKSNIEILRCYSNFIKYSLKCNNPLINNLYGRIKSFIKITMPEYDDDNKSLYDYFPKEDNETPPIIIANSTNSTLENNLHNLSITEKFIILYGIAAGMNYLHENNLVHLNLNPKNIFLNDKKEPLINLDITVRSSNVTENIFYLSPLLSYDFVAPELLNSIDIDKMNQHSKESDVYSFGMLVYFVISEIYPWNNLGLQAILRKLKSNELPKIKNIIPLPFDQLVSDCYNVDPTKRPTFKCILEEMGSSNFIRSILGLNIEQFQDYQKSVAEKEFILPISQCAIRKRSDFQIDKILGTGIYGPVKLAYDNLNNNFAVAYKEIPDKNRVVLEREKEILSKMNFPSIIKIYGLIEPEPGIPESVILFPLSKNGDLNTILLKSKNSSIKGWDYTQRCITLYGIAMGMYKLHQNNIIHRDLKPQNILLNDDMEPWITDFELSKFIEPTQSMFQSRTVGVPIYMSPELLSQSVDETESAFEYDGKLSDVYSFGMVMFYLMSGIQPWSNVSSPFALINKVLSGSKPSIPKNLEEPIVDLIKRCWDSEPEKRPSFDEIVDIISNPDFYKSTTEDFNRKRFYDYQVKLGETQFIKFNLKEIEEMISVDFAEPNVIDTVKIIKDMADKGSADSQVTYGLMLKEGKEVPKDLEGALHYFKMAFDQGDPNGIIEYATCVKEGCGIEKNETAAFNLLQESVDKYSDNIEYSDVIMTLANWYLDIRPRKYGLAYDLYKKADKLGHPEAPAAIGALIEKKKLGSINKEGAMKYYQKSCKECSTNGMYHMATFYHYGIGIEQDLKQAKSLYHQVSINPGKNQGPAVFSLTVLYEEIGDQPNAFRIADFYRAKDMFVGYVRCSDFYSVGIGCPMDKQKAEEYMNIACEKRFADDQLALALIFSRAQGVVKNREKNLYWTEISAKNGNDNAQANTAYHYLTMENDADYLEKAEEWALKSAQAGNVRGMYYLSLVYKAKNMPKEELEYLEKSAQLGLEKALVELGNKYRKKNMNDKAIQCFKEAADNKSPSGLFSYGKELVSGKRVTKDTEEGLKLIEEAAEMGYEKAVIYLVDIYNKGADGVEKNAEKANYFDELKKKIDKKTDKKIDKPINHRKKKSNVTKLTK